MPPPVIYISKTPAKSRSRVDPAFSVFFLLWILSALLTHTPRSSHTVEQNLVPVYFSVRLWSSCRQKMILHPWRSNESATCICEQQCAPGHSPLDANDIVKVLVGLYHPGKQGIRCSFKEMWNQYT